LDTRKHRLPLSWQQIQALRPTKATSARPSDFPSSDSLSIYVQTPPGALIDPNVIVEHLPTVDAECGLSQIRIKFPDGVIGHPLGRGVVRSNFNSLALKEKDRVSSTDSYLPHWMDFNPVPTTTALPSLIRPRIYTSRRGKVTPFYVGGDDRRQVLYDTNYPWLTTGKIYTSDGQSGSGVLVGDRLVLTARHVVPWNSIAAGNWWMKFIPAYFDGREPFGSSYVSDVHAYGTDDSEYNVSHDYAVLRLFTPLGKNLGYLGASEFNDSWRNKDSFINIGYMADGAGPRRPVWQKYWIEDDYEDDDGQYLETEASLNHGASGGPFFAMFDNGQIWVIGVVSGEVSFNGDLDNALAGGSNMVDLINWGRSNWPL
jgi:V8-like Glu-specific endopeptidase